MIDKTEYDKTKRQYKDSAKWLKAPNGKPSKLSEEVWISIHTKSFKERFGDFELKYKLNNLLMKKGLDISNDTTTAENAKAVYKAIGIVKNEDTAMSVNFVNAAFGKIIRHKGYDPRLIGALRTLFSTAIFITNEEPDFDTPRADGTIHKQKRNIDNFSNYINKIIIDEKEYLIRYTIQNAHSNRKDGNHQFHSQYLSEIKISNLTNVSTLFVWAEESVASDLKLALFMKSINEKSLICDKDGEPMNIDKSCY